MPDDIEINTAITVLIHSYSKDIADVLKMISNILQTAWLTIFENIWNIIYCIQNVKKGTRERDKEKKCK